MFPSDTALTLLVGQQAGIQPVMKLTPIITNGSVLGIEPSLNNSRPEGRLKKLEAVVFNQNAFNYSNTVLITIARRTIIVTFYAKVTTLK